MIDAIDRGGCEHASRDGSAWGEEPERVLRRLWPSGLILIRALRAAPQPTARHQNPQEASFFIP